MSKIICTVVDFLEKVSFLFVVDLSNGTQNGTSIVFVVTVNRRTKLEIFLLAFIIMQMKDTKIYMASKVSAKKNSSYRKDLFGINFV